MGGVKIEAKAHTILKFGPMIGLLIVRISRIWFMNLIYHLEVTQVDLRRHDS